MSDVNIEVPLNEQEARYERNWRRVLNELRDLLYDPAYLQHIHDLGLQRLKDGYDTFGDEMYHWHPAVRERNQDEELADYTAYGTSEMED